MKMENIIKSGRDGFIKKLRLFTMKTLKELYFTSLQRLGGLILKLTSSTNLLILLFT